MSSGRTDRLGAGQPGAGQPGTGQPDGGQSGIGQAESEGGGLPAPAEADAPGQGGQAAAAAHLSGASPTRDAAQTFLPATEAGGPLGTAARHQLPQPEGLSSAAEAADLAAGTAPAPVGGGSGGGNRVAASAGGDGQAASGVEDEAVVSEADAGKVVWGRVRGYPFWPVRPLLRPCDVPPRQLGAGAAPVPWRAAAPRQPAVRTACFVT